jgi:hypothetical protein
MMLRPGGVDGFELGYEEAEAEEEGCGGRISGLVRC